MKCQPHIPTVVPTVAHSLGAFTNRERATSRPSAGRDHRASFPNVLSRVSRAFRHWSAASGVFLALCVASAFSAELAAEQLGTIAGKVMSAKTQLALASAEIVVEGRSSLVRTESDGSFRIPHLAPGTYEVTARYTDLDPEIRTVTLAAGETQFIEFELSAEAYLLDAFVVAAEREGQAYAIQQQRQSDVMKNVVASDAFGNLIDTNAGELLKNLPGIFVDYSGEDASGFSIRGIGTDDGMFTIDGNSVANSTTNPETSIGRGVALKNVSVAAIESVEVYKVPPPSSPANANGGVVNMITKNAFDQKRRRLVLTTNLNLNSEALDFSATPGGNREPDRKWSPGFNFYYSEAFLNNRLGISLNLNAYEYYRFNDQVGDIGDTYDSSVTLPAADTWGYVSDVRLTEAASRTQKRAGSLNLDYKLADHTAVFLKTSFSDGKGLSGYSHAMRLRSATGTMNTDASDFDTMSIDDAELAITIGGAPTKTGRNQAWSINPGVKHTFGSVTLDYDGYASRAFTKGAEGINSIGYTGPTGDYILTNVRADEGATIQQVGATGSNDYLDLNNYSGLTLYTSDSLMTDVRNGAKINLKLPVTFLGHPLTLRAGGLYTYWERDTHVYKRNYVLNDSSSTPGYAEFADTTFDNSWAFTNTLMPDWIDPWKVADYYSENPDQFTLDKSTYTQSLYRYTRNLQEEIIAGYLMGSWQINRFNVMAGARYEHTATEATGYQTDNNLSSSDPDYYSMVTGTNSYGNLFPNVQLRYEPLKNLVLRAAFTTTISRPSLTYLIPADTIGDSDAYDYTYVTVSNTNLKPQKSSNYDLSAEYYLPNAGVISVGLFRKEITDYILERSGLMSEIAPELLEIYDQSQYAQPLWVTTAQNVGDATVQGYEFSYRQQLRFLPGFLRNFDVYESFSYNEPAGDIEVAGIKRKVANTRLTYRATKWYAAVGYYWAGRYLKRSPSSTGSDADGDLQWGTDGVYVKAAGRWDLNFTYQFSPLWSLSFDWRNVTQEPERWEKFGHQVRYFQGGTTLNLSLKADF